MPKHKKKFIDKKNAVSFHLVHRSQRDPLQADEDASKTVLVPADAVKPGNESSKSDQRRAQLLEAGIFYDDDYDYLQHLRSRDEINEVGPGVERFTVEAKPSTSKIRLPAEVLPSQEENDIGMLSMSHAITGPQPDWDPDIVEALDGHFDVDDPDNVLEDDFIVKANGPADGLDYSISEDSEMLADRRKQTWIQEHLLSTMGATGTCDPGIDEDDWEDVDDEDEDGGDAHNNDECEGTLTGDDEATDDDDDDDGCHGDLFAQEETKSRFTNYSMSSSVLPRTKGLQLLDERFEQVYAQYDDAEIGALDHEDIGGRLPISSAVLESTLAEFLHSRQPVDKAQLIQQRGAAVACPQENSCCDSPDTSDDEDSSEDVELDDDADNDEKLVRVAVQAPNGEKWDCESILSTYSSLYNHPKLLEEPRKPKDLAKALLSRPRPSREPNPPRAGEREHTVDVPNQRPPQGETADERRARKQLVKLDRKKRREEKKATKDAFKHEKLRQEKEIINVRQNLQGVRIV